MKHLIKLLIPIFSLLGVVNAGFVNPETGWEYQQSTFQAFYMLESTTIDNNVAESGDVIGAFKDGICVGWVYADPNGFTTIPVMGNDGSFPDYMNNGDVAQLKIYDATYGSILPLTAGDVLPGWANNEIFIIDGEAFANNTFGCTDSSACNFDANATADNGSCWSANEGCECSDGQGSEVDCAGTCNGTLELDDCGVCDGGNADQDCAGVCFGSSEIDGCGVCDDDTSNDDLTCTGCTDECADNYDSGNLFDDGSCTYTIPGVENLTASSGPARVILSWDAPDVCGPSLSYEVYDLDGLLVKETTNTTTQILGLTPEIEYCFTVASLNTNGVSDLSDPVCAVPEIAGGISWGLQLSAGINGWGMFDETDEYNYLGVAPNGSNEYDNGLDVPEPPINTAGNYITLYFKHPEWGSVFGNNFTQDVRLEDDEYFQKNLVVYEAEVLSNMSGMAYIEISHFNTPLAVPIYGEFDGQIFKVEDGDLVEFFLQEMIPQTLTLYIGNIVSEAPSGLSLEGGDRSVSIDWDDDNGLYPATSYNIYRDGVLVANVSDSDYFDNEDMEGHEGQGLLYESTYDYKITGVNDAGESTNGHQISNHDGSYTDIPGRSSNDSATTDDNLDPVSIVEYVLSENGTNVSDGVYEIPHNNNPDANEITISIDGSGSSDDDEFDSISSYTWSQTSGADDLDLVSADTPEVSFNVSNLNGSDDKIYTLNLNVTADYPVKGGTASRDSNAEITLTIQAEPNDSPIAPLPFDIIVSGDGLGVYTMDDENDGNDYDSSTSLWSVPHDGDPNTSEANLFFTANSSSDPEGDELTYDWETGLDHEPFTDLNNDGIWSVNEPFEDLDNDGVWDDGDLFYDGINLEVQRESGDYTFFLTVTDVYGATATSEIVIGVEAEANEAPTALAGADQEWFMPNNQDLKDIVIDDNSGADSDNDLLTFSWNVDGYDGDSETGLPALLQSLPEGEHTFTFTTTDSYGASASDDVVISIFNEPASAAVTNVSTSQGLYYVEITFDEGVLEQDDRYTGALDNSVGYDIFRDGDLLATINDEGESSFYYLDNGINPSTTYTYDVQSFNSDDRRGDAVAVSGTTGDRPTVEVVSPNGAEIWSVGDAYPVEISTTDKDYISDIEVLYSADGGQTWTSSGSIDSNGESTTITSDGVEINYDAKVKVVVTDVGDYFGDSKNSNEDASDNSFTLAAHTLSKNYWTGWHLFGAPLVPYLETMEDNLGILGNWGESWISYDQDGNFADLELNLGQGYYLALAQNSTLLIEGDPVTSSSLQDADLELEKGWTLVANPLVTIVDKSTLNVIYEGEAKTWDDAVIEGWIAPHIIAWFEDTHYPSEQLVPFNGYWFHTSRDLTVEVRPHLPLNESARISDSGWMLELQANPTDGVSGGDFIQIGLKDGASNTFVYGEDEYDHPNPGIDSYVDLYFDKNDWIGSVDHRGIMVESPYFSSDMRSSLDDVQVWDIKGNLNNVLGEVELSWTMDAIDRDVHLLVSGEAFNMSEVSSVVVSSMDDVMIVAGDLSTYLAPSDFELSAAYPNPFNPSTSLDLSLNESGHVNIYVYNVLGQIVSTLADSYMDAGYHTFTWNADNVPSGMYLVRVEAGSNVETQKIMLLK